jgi:hypothetical protein
MIRRIHILLSLFAASAVLNPSPAISQDHSPCPAQPNLETSSNVVATKSGLDMVGRLLGRLGIDIDVRTTRDNILKNNPRADQVVIVLTMVHTYCELIWSDGSLTGSAKAERLERMMHDLLTPASGPSPVARTDQHGALTPALILAVSSVNDTRLVADNESQISLPQLRTGFLRDRPYYINKYNKYFVIVGDASTREEGMSAMNRLKKKAPQFDFVLYEPYGTNTNYGIMMATWVPREVALEALQLARHQVARDAFIWACRSTGDSC